MEQLNLFLQHFDVMINKDCTPITFGSMYFTKKTDARRSLPLNSFHLKQRQNHVTFTTR